MTAKAPGAEPPLITPFVGAVVAVTLAYLVAAIVGALQSGNREFILYIAVMAALIAYIGWLHWRFRLAEWSLAALSLWGLLHMAGGLVPVPESWPIDGHIRVLYSWWIIPGRLKYDQAVHAFGFGVATWVCWQIAQASIARWLGVARRDVRPSAAILTICALAGMGLGAANEVVEFAATLAVAETNVGGYVNTGWDLVSNALGSITAALAIAIGSRRARD